MMITFNSNTGLVAEDTAIIRERVATQWKNAFNVSEDTPELNTESETPAGQLIDAQTALIAEKDAEVMRLQNQEITDKTLRLKELQNQEELIKKWNGQLPTTSLGDNIPLLNINK